MYEKSAYVVRKYQYKVWTFMRANKTFQVWIYKTPAKTVNLFALYGQPPRYKAIPLWFYIQSF